MRLNYENAGFAALKSQTSAARDKTKSPAAVGFMRPNVSKVKVYPRVGGGNLPQLTGHIAQMGLSPRGRGSHGRSVRRARAGRAIPAWAGKPSRLSVSVPGLWVYPRAGGGTDLRLPSRDTPAGLSPRGRGNLLSCIRLVCNLTKSADSFLRFLGTDGLHFNSATISKLVHIRIV